MGQMGEICLNADEAQILEASKSLYEQKAYLKRRNFIWVSRFF